MSRWARANHIPLHITCLETAAHAVDIARTRLERAADPAVQLAAAGRLLPSAG